MEKNIGNWADFIPREISPDMIRPEGSFHDYPLLVWRSNGKSIRLDGEMVQLSHPPLIQMEMHKFIKSLFQKQGKFLALGNIFSEIPTNPLWSLKLS